MSTIYANSPAVVLALLAASVLRIATRVVLEWRYGRAAQVMRLARTLNGLGYTAEQVTCLTRATFGLPEGVQSSHDHALPGTRLGSAEGGRGPMSSLGLLLERSRGASFQGHARRG